MSSHPDDFFKKVRKNFLINESHVQDLRQEKKEKKLSQSEIVRMALDSYFSFSKRKRGGGNGHKRNDKQSGR